jgi:large subunit ribosomal protein L9
MELILLKPIRKLGNVGDMVEVAQGYARNYLLPKNFAIRATESNKKDMLARKEELEKESLLLKQKALINIEAYVNKYFTFIKKSSYEGNLYGALSTKEIAEEISTDEIKIKADDIYLNDVIKKVGLFEATLSLHPDVECKIFINVANSQEQAEGHVVAESIKKV